ncbi:MAG: hypothetical protein J6Q84_03770 [Kiritimatiellae bacterium]|nr:hypothetical protein [Kiritimatiellia bacterium]
MLSSIRSVAVSIVSVMAFTFSALASEGFVSTVSSGVSLPVFMSTQMVEPSVFTANISIADWENYSIPYVLRESCRDKLYAVRVTSNVNQSNQFPRSSYCCFAKKDVPVGKQVFDILKDGQMHLVRIKMRHCLIKDLNFGPTRPVTRVRDGVVYRTESDQKVCIIEEVEVLQNKIEVQQSKSKWIQEIDAKFTKTRLSMVQSKDMDYIQGTISARIKSKTKSKYIKKPILRLVVLTEENGALHINEMIMKDVGVNKLPRYVFGSSIESNENQSISIEDLSYNQTQVSLSTYSNVSYYGYTLEDDNRYSVNTYRSRDGSSRSYITYRSSDRKSRTPTGYIKFKLDQEVKMIGYRIELWNNGVLASSYDSMRDNVLKKYDLPEDWYISNKYTQKFKYKTFVGESSK